MLARLPWEATPDPRRSLAQGEAGERCVTSARLRRTPRPPAPPATRCRRALRRNSKAFRTFVRVPEQTKDTRKTYLFGSLDFCGFNPRLGREGGGPGAFSSARGGSTASAGRSKRPAALGEKGEQETRAGRCRSSPTPRRACRAALFPGSS
ncbi:hypothetical protein AAFF_G00178580 [Aldrovandia affinis]|uniref:Uncharacterized protein n=1 Tax=Aldrovandia affinis TaxID=143900 RepID=A0AAD7R087_9TELE|nr:hypothetical protein AAFF_G00178580 [Aldrovandia affinis]